MGLNILLQQDHRNKKRIDKTLFILFKKHKRFDSCQWRKTDYITSAPDYCFKESEADTIQRRQKLKKSTKEKVKANIIIKKQQQDLLSLFIPFQAIHTTRVALIRDKHTTVTFYTVITY